MKFHKSPEFDIKLRYDRDLELGMNIGLILIILVFVISTEFKAKVSTKTVDIIEMKIEEVEQTTQEKVAPPPSLPTVPVASEDEDLPDDIDIAFGEEIDLEDITPPPPPELETAVEFFAVEVKPEMIGGSSQLYKLVKYPEMARRAGVEGLAQIEFTVSKGGTPVDFRIKGERPPGLGFGDAAIEALRKMKFKPGYQRDKPVPVRMSQTIRFEVD